MKIFLIILMLFQVNIAFGAATTEDFTRKKRFVMQLDKRTPEQIEKDCRHPRKLVTAFGTANTVFQKVIILFINYIGVLYVFQKGGIQYLL